MVLLMTFELKRVPCPASCPVIDDEMSFAVLWTPECEPYLNRRCRRLPDFGTTNTQATWSI